jgi:predicted chitinase
MLYSVRFQAALYYEIKAMSKKVVVANFKVSCQHETGQRREIHENLNQIIRFQR